MGNAENINKTLEISKDLEEFKKKHNIEFSIELTFPDYNVLPFDLQLAVAVLKKHNYQFVINFKEVKK